MDSKEIPETENRVIEMRNVSDRILMWLRKESVNPKVSQQKFSFGRGKPTAATTRKKIEYSKTV